MPCRICRRVQNAGSFLRSDDNFGESQHLVFASAVGNGIRVTIAGDCDCKAIGNPSVLVPPLSSPGLESISHHFPVRASLITAICDLALPLSLVGPNVVLDEPKIRIVLRKIRILRVRLAHPVLIAQRRVHHCNSPKPLIDHRCLTFNAKVTPLAAWWSVLIDVVTSHLLVSLGNESIANEDRRDIVMLDLPRMSQFMHH